MCCFTLTIPEEAHCEVLWCCRWCNLVLHQQPFWWTLIRLCLMNNTHFKHNMKFLSSWLVLVLQTSEIWNLLYLNLTKYKSQVPLCLRVSPQWIAMVNLCLRYLDQPGNCSEILNQGKMLGHGNRDALIAKSSWTSLFSLCFHHRSKLSCPWHAHNLCLHHKIENYVWISAYYRKQLSLFFHGNSLDS